MKLELKIGKKAFKFRQTKRNVKIWQVGDSAAMREWNSDEQEPVLTAAGSILVYRAEFWNGIIEHVNSAKVKASVED